MQGIPLFKNDNNNIDPSCLLRTPWMSEEVSDLSTGSDGARLAYQRALADRSGRTLQDILDGYKILERRALAWRSETVSIYQY